MIRLALLLYGVIGTSLAGTCIIVALTLGFDTARPIILAAVIGGAAAIPVSLMIGKRLAG